MTRALPTLVHRMLGSLLALQLHLPSIAAPPAQTHQWVELDPELHRRADRATIERNGPWAQFVQTWGDLKNDEPAPGTIVERMAVNCLTGAYGQTEYPATDPQTNRRIVKRQSLNEIEHAEDFDARLQLGNNSTPLGNALMEFACTCQAHSAATNPTPVELQAAYERYVSEPLSKVEYHLRFLRVKSKPIAQQAIAELATGKPFETVFDEYASSFDAKSFPHGDLGPHLETEFTIDDVRRYRALEVGEFSRTPHQGVYGWEIEKLDSKRTIPAPSLMTIEPRLRQYLARAHGCGWSS